MILVPLPDLKPSPPIPEGMEGILQVGVIIGNDRKTERKTRRTLVLCFLLLVGWTREDWGLGGGGGAGGVDVGENIGSPIDGR